MALRWPCVKFAIGTPGFYGNYHPADGGPSTPITSSNLGLAKVTYNHTPILDSNGKTIGVDITSGMKRHTDCCPNKPPEEENDCPSVSVGVSHTITMRGCLEYRFTYSGRGCSWFGYPIISITSNVPGASTIASIASSSNHEDPPDSCMAGGDSLLPSPFGSGATTNPFYWRSRQCSASNFFNLEPRITINIEFYSYVCNGDQEFNLRIEPA